MDDIPQIDVSAESPGGGKEDYNELKQSKRSARKLLSGKMYRSIPKTMKKILFWRNLSKRQTRTLKVVGGMLFLIIIILGALFINVAYRGYSLMRSGQGVMEEINNKNVSGISEKLGETEQTLGKLRKSYSRISFMRAIPYFGKFVNDGHYALSALSHSLVAANLVVNEMLELELTLESGKDSSSNTGSSTQDKIDFALASIPAVSSKYDELGEYLELVSDDISNINPEDYPDTILGKKVRDNVDDIVQLSKTSQEMYKKGGPLLEVIPRLLGKDGERTYLIVFQNNNELRPTGGFITAYSIAKVNNGKFTPVGSYDIYDLDDKYEPSIPAPEPLIIYLKGPYEESPNYRLRDMNWSPDFSESMELFLEETQNAGVEKVDGVIALDTQVLVNLLGVIGEIQVPGYGGYSNNIVELCNCEQIIYELEHFADIEGPIVWSENEPDKIVYAPPNYLDRKKIIGPMMEAMIQNLLGLPNSKMPELVNAVYKSINEKHLLAYIVDEEIQEALGDFGVTGEIINHQGDYLFINDANLGGKKANMYVVQEVQQEIEVEDDGTVVKKMTISYKNPKPQDNWLNSILPQYIRIYIPRDSEVINIIGLDDLGEPYEEFGKMVLTGHNEVRPLGISQVVIEYKLPFKIEDGVYSLYVQKQPGTKEPKYSIDINGIFSEFELDTDKVVDVKL